MLRIMNKFSMLQSGLCEAVSLPPHGESEGIRASITLVSGEHSRIHQRMHELIVELALTGPVKVLIGGNRYNHYWVNYALAAATTRYEHILDNHIHLSRAETCYQMVELLAQTQADPIPTLILDLLSTFYDEGAPEREINQLMFEAILQLRRLNRRAAVVVSAHSGKNRPRLLEVLKKAVDQVEGPPIPSYQPICQPVLLG